MTDDSYETALAWIRSRPDSIKKLMLQFPPACLVKANIPLSMPAEGQTGEVMSYFESGLVSVQGEYMVLGTPMGFNHRAQCKPEWLEVVGFHTNRFGIVQDFEWIKKVLDGIEK